MMIIHIEGREDGFHDIQSQSHRKAVWLDGYALVPEELEQETSESGGFCNPVFEDGVLVEVNPTEKPEQEQPPSMESRLTELEATMDALLGL